MTLDELKAREDMIKFAVDRWSDMDRRIAYAYLHRGYDMRIVNCERALARALMGDGGDGKGGMKP